MNKVIELYVGLLDEAIEVWRPVLAEHIEDSRYRILEQEYFREIETWQFDPGDIVECETVKSSNGPIFAAIRKI